MRCDGLLDEMRNIVDVLPYFHFICNGPATLVDNLLALDVIHCSCEVVDAHVVAILIWCNSFPLMLQNILAYR